MKFIFVSICLSILVIIVVLFMVQVRKDVNTLVCMNECLFSSTAIMKKLKVVQSQREGLYEGCLKICEIE